MNKIKKLTNETKAHELAKKQREISIAEFFEKNRHLLGFDNKRKALLTTIKEAVDNALDACEEADILPEIYIDVVKIDNTKFRVIVEDNGPGIIEKQIPNIFGKLLYGSKFHSLKQSRGQQGIGISAAGLYGQLTTGKPVKITSKIGKDHDAIYIELKLDTNRNKPVILKRETTDFNKDHGTKIEITLEANYVKGDQSVDEYLKQTAIVNPHATIIYTNPNFEQFVYARTTEKLPKKPKEIKPHPHGIELGKLIKMIESTQYRTIQAFFENEFSSIGVKTIKEVCVKSFIPNTINPKKLSRNQIERLYKVLNETKIKAPPTDCLSPITAELLEKGLKKVIDAEFYASVSRPVFVYRGNPIIIEAGIAYGGNQPNDKSARILRFANKVPLLYQQGACAITKAITSINWKPYGLQQSTNSIPVGPITILVHIASVWVPYTSESKEAIAHYPEIIKEIRLALQDIGRKLGSYVRKKYRLKDEIRKKDFIEKYIPHMIEALKEILDLSEADQVLLKNNLEEMLKNIKPVEQMQEKLKVESEFDESLAIKGNIEDELLDLDINNEEE